MRAPECLACASFALRRATALAGTASFLILSGLIAASTSGCAIRTELEVMPAETLKAFSMTWWERPRGYSLISNSDVLREAGIDKNPDYITRNADIEAILQLGGLASILAMYGVNDEPRLLIQGIYFKDRNKLENYISIQESRKKPVRAFSKETENGWWLLKFARDTELTYTERESNSIRRGINRYRRRLGLEEVFDSMDKYAQTLETT